MLCWVVFCQIESSMLGNRLIKKVHLEKKLILVWTVNLLHNKLKVKVRALDTCFSARRRLNWSLISLETNPKH